MRYRVYSLHTCCYIVSGLTREQADEAAGPFGSFAIVHPMPAMSWPKRRLRAIRAHDCTASRCGPICTHGDW